MASLTEAAPMHSVIPAGGKPPASAGYRGSDLVLWRKAAVAAGRRFFWSWMHWRHSGGLSECLLTTPLLPFSRSASGYNKLSLRGCGASFMSGRGQFQISPLPLELRPRAMHPGDVGSLRGRARRAMSRSLLK